MAGRVPLEVGSHGTVGSLLKREIEYYKGRELEHVESCMNSEGHSEEMAPGICSSCPGLRYLVVSWRKKKGKNSGDLLCGGSVSQGLHEIHGFSCQYLRVVLKHVVTKHMKF